VAGNEPQIPKQTHAEILASIPGHKLRPGAYKMQLRPEEEAALPLVRFTSALWLPLYWGLPSALVPPVRETCPRKWTLSIYDAPGPNLNHDPQLSTCPVLTDLRVI
jgi:hypothetical protein